VSRSGEVGAHTPGVAGRAYPPVTFQIEPERAAAFARAIGADPAAGVPPTFAAVYSLGATAPQLFGDPEAAVDFDRLLHAEQEFTWSRHPRPGEMVTSRGQVASDISRRGMRFVTFGTETTDQAGQPLCRSRALFVIRSSQGSPPTRGEASELVG
jgi:N-terminal half of MaoC dehydratase